MAISDLIGSPQREDTRIHSFLAILAASVTMLDPAAWSMIDASMFGRKRFDLDRPEVRSHPSKSVRRLWSIEGLDRDLSGDDAEAEKAPESEQKKPFDSVEARRRRCPF